MRILLVEHNSAISEEVEYYLEAEGIVCDVVQSADKLEQLDYLYSYKMIILSAQLPNNLGFNILSAFRALEINTPLIMLFDHDNPLARALALRMGADDCIVCPFDEREFVARVHALRRRSKGWFLTAGRKKVLAPDGEQLKSEADGATMLGHGLQNLLNYLDDDVKYVAKYKEVEVNFMEVRYYD